MVDGSASKPALKQDTGYMVEETYDEVWNLPYIPVHSDGKTIFGSMTTYNPPLFGLKKMCDS